mgnify:CR=1 FL=1
MKWTNPTRITSKVLLVLLVLQGSLQSHGQQKKDNALLWEISGNGLQQPSYLFGTIHMVCKEDFQLSESVKQKLGACTEIGRAHV